MTPLDLFFLFFAWDLFERLALNLTNKDLVRLSQVSRRLNVLFKGAHFRKHLWRINPEAIKRGIIPPPGLRLSHVAYQYDPVLERKLPTNMDRITYVITDMNLNVSKIRCNTIILYDTTLDQVLQALENPNVTSLKIANVVLDVACAVRLATHRRLKELRLTNCSVTDEIAEIFTNAELDLLDVLFGNVSETVKNKLKAVYKKRGAIAKI